MRIITHNKTAFSHLLTSKILVIRLRPRTAELVHPNQSAFVRGRNLHNDFILVRQLARKLHKCKIPGALLMLDISSAFNSISWPFLFEVLRARGFSGKWLTWMAILLSSASSRVVLNGVAGDKISHVRGIRQGDLLAPLLLWLPWMCLLL